MVSKTNLISLRKRSEFENLSRFGRRYRPCSWIVINYKKNELGHLRCGWTFPKYVGNAVVRNRFKRWSREFFRTYGSGILSVSVDVNVVLLRQGKDFYKYVDREEYLRQLEKAAQIIKKYKS